MLESKSLDMKKNPPFDVFASSTKYGDTAAKSVGERCAIANTWR